jgi:hypothetical protein
VVRKITLTSLQKKITAVANNKKLNRKDAERKLISLYKKRARLIAKRREK